MYSQFAWPALPASKVKSSEKDKEPATLPITVELKTSATLKTRCYQEVTLYNAPSVQLSNPLCFLAIMFDANKRQDKANLGLVRTNFDSCPSRLRVTSS